MLEDAAAKYLRKLWLQWCTIFNRGNEPKRMWTDYNCKWVLFRWVSKRN